MKDFDIGIIGAGIAGSFATLKIAKDYKNVKTIVFDIGRPPMKRRRQLEGWLGCLPNSDGKLYQNDISKVSQLVGTRRTKSAHTFLKRALEEVGVVKIIKDRHINNNLEKKIKKMGYDISLNDYIQIYPKEIHLLSKYMVEIIEKNKNIVFNFDNEVVGITKQKNVFVVTTEEQEYSCKKIIIAVGRSGWRWAHTLFNNFGIVENNDISKFGIRIEASSCVMKDFNKSNCVLSKSDLEIGPFSWFGTVIPEDHLDMAISSFRSNENRWKTDKVSFNLIGNRYFPSSGFEQTDRIGKLTFVLSNDRIIKEKVSTILNEKSKISSIKEYDWLKPAVMELSNIIPEIINKAYFHVPTIIPTTSKIILGDNLESEINGMFVVGESAGVHGILSAALTGIVVASSVCK